MRCAICGKSNQILTSSLCLRCYVSKQSWILDLEPLYPGDIVEIVKEDHHQGMRGIVVEPPSTVKTADVWLRLKQNRDSEPYYLPYARDDVKLYSRIHAGA